MLTDSLYSTPPPRDRADDLLRDYEGFLAARNGEGGAWDRREALMASLSADPAPYRGHLDPVRFDRRYAGLERGGAVDDAELALLSFVKINAGEAYGVEVTTAAREPRYAHRDEPLFRVERVLACEETYHTRLLLGATEHFEGIDVSGAWKPAWPLRLLIFCLAQFPPALFHPVLLGSEIAGVFSFNWLLSRLDTLFPDDPAVRESMARRLVEILVDEVGHIAFNRLALAGGGLPAVRPIARAVLAGQEQMSPEMVALGFDADARRAFERFDLRDLPEEVRRRAFFA
ncbi:MAG: hypothetical protein R3F59_15235 [Myxococcota bacterium]